MHALPAAPAPPPRRQVFVGTALAGVATVMLDRRHARRLDPPARAGHRRRGHVAARRASTIPEVPANVMLIGVWALVVFAQWAVYAARRGDKAHTGPGPRPRRR